MNTPQDSSISIQFTIKGMDKEHACFLVEKIAPAFGMDILKEKLSFQKGVFNVSELPANAQSFERYLASEVQGQGGTYIVQ